MEQIVGAAMQSISPSVAPTRGRDQPQLSVTSVSSVARMKLEDSRRQRENEVPQPQVRTAKGFLKMKPRFFRPSSMSICVPRR